MPAVTTPPLPVSRAAMAIAVALVLLLASTAALWGYYGTTVFYEMLLAGWAACF